MKIDDSIILQCKRMYEEEHLTCAEIARRMKLNEATVRRRLKQLGVTIIKQPNQGKFKTEEVITQYNKGIPIWQIAKEFKSSENTISKVLKENGIEVARNGVKSVFNHHIFDVIDTEEKAYWLGFIFADGCVLNVKEEKRNFAFELGLALKDIEHLKKFCKFLNLPESRIKIKKQPVSDLIKSENMLCRIQLSNKHLWETLNSYGCIPNKTYNENFPNGIFKDEELVHHFIRGVFDGDGWVYIDKRKIIIAGVCGSELFLKDIMKYLPNKLYKEPIKCADTNVIKVIKWAGTKAITFLNYIYNNASIVLTRKYIISAPFISNDNCKLGNIGETPEMDNPEITEKSNKFSVS